MKYLVFGIFSFLFSILIATNVLAWSPVLPAPCKNSSNYWHECPGVRIFENGDKYIGYFRDNKKDGRGKYYFTNGDWYDGDFNDNKIDGRGIYYFNNGDKYSGYFSDNKKDGRGIYYFNNGDKYDGTFEDGKINSQGTYRYYGFLPTKITSK